MESFKIDILNPKAKSLLKSLADLKLIRIHKVRPDEKFGEILAKLRSNDDVAPSISKIAAEVDAVRKARYEEKNNPGH